MSILDALKKLIAKRGGTPSGSNIAEVINNYANEDSPSPSGGGSYVVHATKIWDDDQGKYGIDVTEPIENVFGAIESGQFGYMDVVDDKNGHEYLYLEAYYPGESQTENVIMLKSITTVDWNSSEVFIRCNRVEYDLAYYGGWAWFYQSVSVKPSGDK